MNDIVCKVDGEVVIAEAKPGMDQVVTLVTGYGGGGGSCEGLGEKRNATVGRQPAGVAAGAGGYNVRGPH